MTVRKIENDSIPLKYRHVSVCSELRGPTKSNIQHFFLPKGESATSRRSRARVAHESASSLPCCSDRIHLDRDRPRGRIGPAPRQARGRCQSGFAGGSRVAPTIPVWEPVFPAPIGRCREPEGCRGQGAVTSFAQWYGHKIQPNPAIPCATGEWASAFACTGSLGASDQPGRHGI